MNALGQKLACARRAPTREEMDRRDNGDASDIRAHQCKVASASWLSWLDVEDHAQPGDAIWIVALAAIICIGLTYAYFSDIAG
jgi:hypothetical protein